jgi:hypothetical protein
VRRLLEQLVFRAIRAAIARARRIGFDVKHAATAAAAAPARQAPQQDLRSDLHQHDRIERYAEGRELGREAIGLGDGAREAIEDEAAGGVGPCQTLADDAQHDVVGDQLAGVHDDFRRAAECRACGHGLTQQVTGRHLRHAMA